MERIDRYETLADLATRHMTRGVRANTMVSQAEYGRAVETGTLLAQVTPAGLLLARDRGDHFRFNFYLNDITGPLGGDLPTPAVTEVAYRPRDIGCAQRGGQSPGPASRSRPPEAQCPGGGRPPR